MIYERQGFYMAFINTINQTPKRPQINETKSNIVERRRHAVGEGKRAGTFLTVSCEDVLMKSLNITL